MANSLKPTTNKMIRRVWKTSEFKRKGRPAAANYRAYKKVASKARNWLASQIRQERKLKRK